MITKTFHHFTEEFFLQIIFLILPSFLRVMQVEWSVGRTKEKHNILHKNRNVYYYYSIKIIFDNIFLHFKLLRLKNITRSS